jgi:hypothetical protein
MTLPAVARAPGVGDHRAARGWGTAGVLPGRTIACSRRLSAFARTSLRALVMHVAVQIPPDSYGNAVPGCFHAGRVQAVPAWTI